MVRDCGGCAMWVKGTQAGATMTLRTGYCTHSSIGRVTRAGDHCGFWVRGKGDLNVSFDAFERLQAGKVLPKHLYGAGPRRVDLDALRRKSGGL